jgi:exosome complex component RRP4
MELASTSTTASSSSAAARGLRYQPQHAPATAATRSIDVVLGVNGYVWISKHVDSPADSASGGGAVAGATGIANMEEAVSASMYSSRNDPIDPETMREIVRVRGVITALVENGVRVDEESVERAYGEAVDMARASDGGEDDIYLGGERGVQLAATLTGR